MMGATLLARSSRPVAPSHHHHHRRALTVVAFRNSNNSNNSSNKSSGDPSSSSAAPTVAATTASPPPPPATVAFLTTAGATLTPEESASLARVLELSPPGGSSSGSSSGSSTGTASATAPPKPPTAAAALASDPMAEHLMHTIASAAEHASAPDLALLEGAVLAAEQLFMAQQQQQQQQGVGGTTTTTTSTVSALEAATRPQAVAAFAQAATSWQPVFASSGGWPRLLFIPVPEFFLGTAASSSSSTSGSGASGSGAQQPFDVLTELGPLTTHFYGERRWNGSTVLEYEVSSVRIEWVGGGQRGGDNNASSSSSSSSPPLGFTIKLPPPLRLKNALFFFAAAPGRWACARSRLGGTMLLRADPPAARRYA
jgi:hypothetical protein